MIGNTDWSSSGQHNMKTIQLQTGTIPLAYDFDMTGLVNAPYATVNEALSISSVTERLYRGYCRNELLVQHVRSEYLKNESVIIKIINDHQSVFTPQDFKGINKFISEFFDVLKNDNTFSESILVQCRKD
jgi:hypothetical protein